MYTQLYISQYIIAILISILGIFFMLLPVLTEEYYYYHEEISYDDKQQITKWASKYPEVAHLVKLMLMSRKFITQSMYDEIYEVVMEIQYVQSTKKRL